MGNRYEGIDEHIVKPIRINAGRIIKHKAFDLADLPDVEQELHLEVHRRLPHYDPSRAALRTFVSRVVENCAATLIEARRAGVRDYRKESGSLDERVVDKDGERGETSPVISKQAFLRSVVASSRHEQELDSLRIDLRTLLAQLSEDEQALCERLKTSTVSEISRETGRPRGTLYEQIARIRARFEKAGLAAYLGKHGAARGRRRQFPPGSGK
jgi:RNA polymerase sigma-70 factor (ECF subfamily)